MKEIKNTNDFLNAKKENSMIVFLPDSEVADYIANGSLNLLQEDTELGDNIAEWYEDEVG